jgi:hypothetical protein
MIGLIIAILIPFVMLTIVDRFSDHMISSRFSNFKRLDSVKSSSYNTTEFAEIDHHTGFIFRKTKTRKIFKEHTFWKFLDTGKFTSGFKVDDLDAAEKAQKLFEVKQS